MDTDGASYDWPIHTMVNFVRPRTWVAISLLAVLVAPWQVRSTPPKKQWSFHNDIGLAVVKSGRVCLSIPDRSLAPDSKVRLVQVMPPQTELQNARVAAVDQSCSNAMSGATDLHGYQLRREHDVIEGLQ